ncbi:RHS repeat-associated core domain-containing protein, partial [Sorangium cellulosum]|uniref:RHS repeat-associated core domain-containing protein n=1 Tax=Sorangium cellulosum TaxID=56 RepID=UPI000A76B3C2
GARSYEPRLGVWLSPDPVLAEYMAGKLNGGVYDPIHLGVYTYTRNNPLVFVDPTGMSETCADGVCESFTGPLDADEQRVSPDAIECTSGGCTSVSPTAAQLHDIHQGRVEREDKPLETPLVDPIDILTGVTGVGAGLVKVGSGALRRLVAREAASELESLAVKGASVVLPRSGPIARSVGAMSRAEAIARKLKLNVNSETTRQVLNSLDYKVVDFVGKFRQGGIHGALPREVLDMTVEEALKHSSTVRKLLIDSRFVK